MSDLLPARFLFRVSLPVPRVAGIPRKGSRLLDLPVSCALPDFGELDQQKSFATVRMGWNEQGLGLSVLVPGKSRAPRYNADVPTLSDGVQLWVDTRNTQNVHRASRYCHHFLALPTGGGPLRDRPRAQQLPIARAREETPLCAPDNLQVVAHPEQEGYQLEIWLPAEVLNGYAPESNPRLGFYLLVRDSELGDQVLSVGEEFPYAWDPSLWWTLELQDA